MARFTLVPLHRHLYCSKTKVILPFPDNYTQTKIAKLLPELQFASEGCVPRTHQGWRKNDTYATRADGVRVIHTSYFIEPQKCQNYD